MIKIRYILELEFKNIQIDLTICNVAGNSKKTKK